MLITLPRENPPIGNTSKKKIIKNPIEPKDRKTAASFSGNINENILLPSSGGIGIILKIAKSRLSLVTVNKNQPRKIVIVPSSGTKAKILISAAAKIAIRILVAGPAKETKAISFLPSRKLKGSTGTGFAAPKTTGEPEIIKSRGRAMLIIGSMWLFGLRVSLPIMRAVGSPRRSATYPCAIS